MLQNTEKIWEAEYRNPKLITLSEQPQKFFLRFLKFLKKRGVALENLKVLDLGCGTGRNAIFLAQKGVESVGIDISTTAIKIAEKRAEEKKLNIKFLKQSIAKPYPFKDNYFDVILDITSSNALSSGERQKYLRETKRVLKSGGILFLRTLRLEGDKNAKNLIKKFPGREPGTYIMPEVGLAEKVFSEKELREIYKDFEILEIKREEGYSLVGGKKFKRKFWVVYFKNLKKSNLPPKADTAKMQNAK